MQKRLIVANWKMNPQTSTEAKELLVSVLSDASDFKNIELVICPPFVYFSSISAMIYDLSSKFQVSLGAQNMHWEQKGAFTGEISAQMLKEFGVEYVVEGHSERRWIMGETDEMINKKIKTALKSGLIPILAVGEKERNNFDSSGRHINTADDVVIDQLTRALDGVPVSKIKDVVIAYEPVWAIGTGLADNPDDALSVSLLIRKVISKMTDDKTARAIKILYGGSVNSKNIAEFLKQDGIDGALVGGASIDKDEFTRILEIVSSL
ncbi:MAG: triose-phosphate isomerase [Parcubacteria group bacterium]|nr:triose-phosphate isomerase [Parcubacteria group bacterium]